VSFVVRVANDVPQLPLLLVKPAVNVAVEMC
jgi:hypothetical protein